MNLQSVALTRIQALQILTAEGEPLELVDIQLGGHTQRWFKNGPQSLRQLFEETASNKPFLVYETERFTYADAWQQACALGHGMVHTFGIKKGDRVAISMRNYPEWMIAFTAITSIGAVAVCMNALWQTGEMVYGLQDSGAKLLIADPERLERLAQGIPIPALRLISVRTSVDEPGRVRWATLLGKGTQGTSVPVTMPYVPIDPDDPANMLYTSGSTGQPKGVVTSHRNVLAALLSWELDRRAGELVGGLVVPEPVLQPATLLAVPLFHVTGLNAVYLSSYRMQRRVVSMYKWNPQEAAELIEEEKITSFVAPAAMTGDLVRLAGVTQRSLASLLVVGGGGAARAPEQVRKIDAIFSNAAPNTGWGMTETCAIGTGIGGPDYLLRPASSGRCSAVLALRVIDGQGNALGPHQRGELLVRGTSMFNGYWNRPELNTQVFTDGWFHTGDVAYLDEEGYLFIVDRIKDLIIRGGENIGCGKIENILLMHPQVHEVAVYAVPDERLGEEVGATVHGDVALEMDVLRDYLRLHLAKFEVPRYLLKSPERLPRTATGKILRRQIQAQALDVLAARPDRVDALPLAGAPG